ncbi:sigma-70 family RNA polymerase sigma factor [Nocardiopsis akebiae]|uniref:Sigma-70 family RNA polymerase sigma factor n=1 Tax=Nocardiopsis akebiae TaxID=2831968 RepID=A0ABX8CDM0_9ACTN|nr:sigma-70 family RNA polymerase sigma factor [Nocardiopsis akebiae]QUX30653.1 sigma-70 family RNA polymerase sigma factor [Nocardiopsis akebiae]
MLHDQERPFEVLRRSVELITCGSGQPTLPTWDLDEVDARQVSAAQVIELLRHAPQEVTDALWHRLFARSRAGEATWTVIAAGAMLPRMVVACSRYARVSSQHIPDVEAEMLTALLEQVRSLPLEASDVGARLWSAVANTANRYGYRHARDVYRCVEYNPNAHATDQAADGRGPVTVLADAVLTGALSPVEADLIARTRLERSTLARVAEELGLTYITARRWRRSAEEKLTAGLEEEKSTETMSAIAP